MNIIKLQPLEVKILLKIKAGKNDILLIPCDIYASILYYSEQIEDYTTCILLRNLIDKVSLVTMAEIVDDDHYETGKPKLLNP